MQDLLPAVTVGNTSPVKSFPANAFGLYDMHGNVWEWTQSCLNGDYTNGIKIDMCMYRFLRGGSWLIDPEYLRSAHRATKKKSGSDNHIGFRLVQGG